MTMETSILSVVKVLCSLHAPATSRTVLAKDLQLFLHLQTWAAGERPTIAIHKRWAIYGDLIANFLLISRVVYSISTKNYHQQTFREISLQ